VICSVCGALIDTVRTAVKFNCVGLTEIVDGGGGGGGGGGAEIVSVIVAVADGRPGDATVTLAVTDPVTGCAGRLTTVTVVGADPDPDTGVT
jgi:hypothetical protein